MANFDDFELDLRVSEKDGEAIPDSSTLCVTALICWSVEMSYNYCPTRTKPGCVPPASNTKTGCPSATGK